MFFCQLEGGVKLSGFRTEGFYRLTQLLGEPATGGGTGLPGSWLSTGRAFFIKILWAKNYGLDVILLSRYELDYCNNGDWPVGGFVVGGVSR